MNRTGDRRGSAHRRRQRGAATVEFALVAPVLVALVLGVIEFGLLFGQRLDITNGAREGARLAAVNHRITPGVTGAAQAAEIVATACDRMELSNGTQISISFPGGTAVGDTVEFEVEAPYIPVTGLYDPLLAGSTLDSEVTIRLEQAATYSAVSGQVCP